VLSRVGSLRVEHRTRLACLKLAKVTVSNGNSSWQKLLREVSSMLLMGLAEVPVAISAAAKPERQRTGHSELIQRVEKGFSANYRSITVQN